jgi:histidinol phosphatase-like enzyme
MSDNDFHTSVIRNLALLLDRDGVINVNHGCAHPPENFDFMDGFYCGKRGSRPALQACGYHQ